MTAPVEPMPQDDLRREAAIRVWLDKLDAEQKLSCRIPFDDIAVFVRLLDAERRGRESAAAENPQLRSTLAKTSSALLDAIQEREQLRKLDMEALEKLEEQAEAAQARIAVLEATLQGILVSLEHSPMGTAYELPRVLSDVRAALAAGEVKP